MQTIISSLLHDATAFGDATKHTTDFVKLGMQCMERLSLIVDSLPKHLQTRLAPLSLPPTDNLNSLDSGSAEKSYASLPAYYGGPHQVPPSTPTSLVLHSPTNDQRTVHPARNIPSLMTSPTSTSSTNNASM